MSIIKKKNQIRKVYSLSLDRVTTDAVHRRLQCPKNTDSPKEVGVKKEKGDGDYYFCTECNQYLPASPGKKELKLHFETVTHNQQYCSCVYCSKPVYAYKWKTKLEIYHMCR